MFKTLSLFALALLLVAAVAAPIDLSNVPSAAGSTADSLETNELLSQDEDSVEYGSEDSDDDDDSVLNDVSELTDNEEEFIKGKLYGNYCGVSWCGNQDVGEGPSCNFNVESKDDVDACCKSHDACCGGVNGQSRGKHCNHEIHDCLEKASVTKKICWPWKNGDDCKKKRARNTMLGIFGAAKAFGMVCGGFK